MKSRQVLTSAIVAFLLNFFLTLPLHAEEHHLTILHTNDLHAQYFPEETYDPKTESYEVLGGVVPLAHVIRSLRKEIPNTILLDAGDRIDERTYMCWHSDGTPDIAIMNAMGYDAMVLGNHEFYQGREKLKKFLNDAKFSILSANLVYRETGELYTRPYIIKEVGSLRVAIIGITTQFTNLYPIQLWSPPLIVADPVEAARRCVNEVKDKADIILALTHLGLEDDERLAREVPEIDAIIGGHSHRRLEEPLVVNNTLICQAWDYGRVLGRLDLTYDTNAKQITSWRGELIRVRPGQYHDVSDIQAIVDELDSKFTPIMNQVVGKLAVDFVKDGRRESAAGNWFADVLRKRAGSDIGLFYSGAQRRNLQAGDITVNDLYEANEMGNIVIVRLSGFQLLTLLMANFSSDYDILQVSGMRIKFDPNREGISKFVRADVNGKPVKVFKKYTVATTELHFHAANVIFGGGTPYKDTGIEFRKAQIEEFREKGEITSTVEGRIVFIEKEENESRQGD